jgi:hypothetical protein
MPYTLALTLMESPAAMAVGLFNSILAPFFIKTGQRRMIEILLSSAQRASSERLRVRVRCSDGNLENAIKTGATCADWTCGNGIFEWKKDGVMQNLRLNLWANFYGQLEWNAGMQDLIPSPPDFTDEAKRNSHDHRSS